jgi:hypothetical protein
MPEFLGKFRQFPAMQEPESEPESQFCAGFGGGIRQIPAHAGFLHQQG